MDNNQTFNPETPILLYDGTTKLAKSITCEDILMGEDSSPIKIIEIKPGNSDMYKIVPTKGNPFIVGKDHILSLKLSKNALTVWRKDKDYFEVRWYNEIGKNNSVQFKPKYYKSKDACEIEANKYRDALNEKYKDTITRISVSNYIRKNKTWKTFWKLYRTGVEFKSEFLEIDPYLVGLWLGDGTSSKSEITSVDHEILEYLEETLPDMNMTLKRKKLKGNDTISYSMKGNEWRNNPFLEELQNTGMLNNKHISSKHKFSSLNDRLSLLAGIIDTDGSLSEGCYDVIQKSNALSNDIVYIARSCGLAAYSSKCIKGCWYKGEYKEGEYNRICISGHVNSIPVLIARKKADPRKQIKNVLNQGLTVEPFDEKLNIFIKTDSISKGIVLGDFTVTGGVSNT